MIHDDLVRIYTAMAALEAQIEELEFYGEQLKERLATLTDLSKDQ